MMTEKKNTATTGGAVFFFFIFFIFVVSLWHGTALSRFFFSQKISSLALARSTPTLTTTKQKIKKKTSLVLLCNYFCVLVAFFLHGPRSSVPRAALQRCAGRTRATAPHLSGPRQEIGGQKRVVVYFCMAQRRVRECLSPHVPRVPLRGPRELRISALFFR